MTDTTTLALAWRVSVAVFVILAPTFLFLQFMRLLEWMRDDDLIAQLVEQHDLVTTDTDRMLAALSTGPSPEARESIAMESDDGTALTRCENCGQRNARASTYCAGCLSEID